MSQRASIGQRASISHFAARSGVGSLALWRGCGLACVAGVAAALSAAWLAVARGGRVCPAVVSVGKRAPWAGLRRAALLSRRCCHCQLSCRRAKPSLAGPRESEAECEPAEREPVVSGESAQAPCVIHGGVILIHCVLLNVLLSRRTECKSGCVVCVLQYRAGVRVSAGVLSHAESLADAEHVLYVLCVLEFCAAQAVLRAANAVAGVHCCWGRACAARAWCSSRVAEGSLAAGGIARRGSQRPPRAGRDAPAPPAWRRDPFQKGFFLIPSVGR